MLGSLAGAMLVLAAQGAPAQAQAAGVTRSLKPAHESRRAVVFDLDAVEPSQIVNAHVKLRAWRHRLHHWLERQQRPHRKAMRHARRRLDRGLRAGRVRAVANRSAKLRLAKPIFARGGRLRVTLRPAPRPDPGLCTFDPATMTATGCTPTIDDTGAEANPDSIWGKTDCEDASRQQLIAGGADPHAAAVGGAQSNDAFRRLTVFDGDDVWGERCELGLNDLSSGPTVIYEEGQRWITMLSVRLPEGSFPLVQESWQDVMQMHQTQPSDGGGGSPPLALMAFDGQWMLSHSTSSEGWTVGMEQLWQASATADAWVRFAFDVTYSQDPAKGYVKLYADLNGDGDATDPGEQSQGSSTYTMKRELADRAGETSDSDGIAAGESIPLHLRVGIYHDPAIACPAGCAVDIDNVQAVRAG